jgi:lipoprotein NlpD
MTTRFIVLGRRATVLPLVLACSVLGASLLGGCSTGWAPADDRGGAEVGEPTITGSSYTVKAGDTLRSVAARAGLQYHQIAEWNGIKEPYLIYVGQRLRLAPRDVARGGVASAAAPKTDGGSVKPASAEASRARATRGGEAAAPPSSLRWRWPTGGKVSQTFAANDPGRKGLKIRGTAGQPVVAAESGQVVYSGSGLVGYGPLIIIKHDNNYLSAYGHNRKLLAQQGQQVAGGAKIAEMGLAGGQPVLHFEIRRDGEPIDPLSVLPKR